MAKNLDVWRSHAGRTYNRPLKSAHVVPLLESLEYNAEEPTAIDVGGGTWSIVRDARLPGDWRRRMAVATVDIAVSDHQSRDRVEIEVDIEDLVADAAPIAQAGLEKFLAERTRPPRAAGADLVVYSDVLNYVGYKDTIAWFDQMLSPGGFTVIVNKPGRGFPALFSEEGVTSNRSLIDFMTEELGHVPVSIGYPGISGEGDTSLLVMATRKPQQ